MGVREGAGENGSSRGRGRPAKLPVVATHSRDEMAAVLDEYQDLLRERAVGFLGPDTAEIDEAISRTRFRLLSEHAISSHALRDILRVLRDVCRVVLARRAREPEEWTRKRAAGVPVDSELGPLEGPTKDATDQLSPLQRNRVHAATVKSHEEVAHEEGLSVAVFRRRLYQARERVRGLLRRGGHTLPAFLVVVTRRLRLSMAQAVNLPSVAALAPVLVWSLFGGPVSRFIPPADASPNAAVVAAVGSQAGAASPGTRQTTHAATLPNALSFRTWASRPAAPPADSASGGLLPLTPDTPETTDVRSVTPSPHYGQDHTVIALGLGHRCACPVLLRSMDGGASWQSTTVAASGDQVALPSNFPTDGRIFIGAEPSPTSVDWVSAGWGQPFAPLSLPPSAAGHLAVVGGDLLSVGTDAVWSLHSGSSVAMPLLAYSGQPATIATTEDAAFILAPAHTLGVGAGVGAEPGLFVCAPGCRYVGSVPLPGVGPLAVSGPTVVAAAGPAVVLSEDGGRTFQAIGPASAPQFDAVAVNGLAAWVVGQAGAEVRQVDGGPWKRVQIDQAAVRDVVPLSGGRLIATLRIAGLRCSLDGGTTWVPRCDPEP